jgi:hypothetical protein
MYRKTRHQNAFMHSELLVLKDILKLLGHFKTFCCCPIICNFCFLCSRHLISSQGQNTMIWFRLHKHPLRRNPSQFSNFFSAQLLLEDRGRAWQEAHHHLRPPQDRGRRGADLRLQVPVRGGQDPVPVQRQKVPEIHELNILSDLFCCHDFLKPLCD